MTTESPAERPTPATVTGVRRIVYIGLGFAFVGLAALGAVLPLLPTTPFVLLASYFFVRSSERLHRWLLRTRVFGPLLNDWHEYRGLRPSVKAFAFASLALAGTASMLVGNLPPHWLVVLVVMVSIGAGVIWRLPTVRKPSPAPSPAASSGEMGADLEP